MLNLEMYLISLNQVKFLGKKSQFYLNFKEKNNQNFCFFYLAFFLIQNQTYIDRKCTNYIKKWRISTVNVKFNIKKMKENSDCWSDWSWVLPETTIYLYFSEIEMKVIEKALSSTLSVLVWTGPTKNWGFNNSVLAFVE